MATFWRTRTFHHDGKFGPDWCGMGGPSPFHSIYHQEQSCGVRSSWEGQIYSSYFSSTLLSSVVNHLSFPYPYKFTHKNHLGVLWFDVRRIKLHSTGNGDRYVCMPSPRGPVRHCNGTKLVKKTTFFCCCRWYRMPLCSLYYSFFSLCGRYRGLRQNICQQCVGRSQKSNQRNSTSTLLKNTRKFSSHI